ncbi:ArnT family glycosyltransferase [Yinghuangia soli]|uniref:Glycosyltransferase family 39 protein n=1 Tax=Yinghuangia soli TaxID=2908204 RepID=A0AA41TYK7_9ACTN|nr:glycosyltransferase family 39 protein [Yinghuangia soli]MCF2526290.1 glycosyltransferase family 39 protein [Yinghuangia soli]
MLRRVLRVLLRPPVTALLLVSVAVATHLPSFLRAFWNPDEGFLATQARILGAGADLYSGVVDRKPPLLPYLYAAVFGIFGDDRLWPVKVLALGAHVLTAVLLLLLARRRYGPTAGLAAGLLYLVASTGLSPPDAHAANFEVFMLPATAAAVLLADRGRYGAAGVAVAVAALTKQSGGAVLIPVLWLAWRTAGRGGVSRALVGTALPFLAIAPLFGVGRFLFWVVTGSGGYLSLEGGWLRALARASVNLGIVVAASLPLVWAALRGRRLRADADLWLWLAASFIAISAGTRFFGHYFLQLLPALVMVGVAGIARGALRWRTAAVYALLSACVFSWLALNWPESRLRHIQEVGRAVRAETHPGEHVLIWGMNPALYYYSERPPATRFLTAGFLTNFSGGRPEKLVTEELAVRGAWDQFAADLTRTRPELVIDDSGQAAYRPDRIPKFDEFLRENYKEESRSGHVVIYRRITP